MFCLPWRAFASALVCLALVACSKQHTVSALEREPLCRDCNIILISMDTVRADHVGAYGYERQTTPNVDALAARSVLFENAVSQASWTLPARTSSVSRSMMPSSALMTSMMSSASFRASAGVDAAGGGC